MPAAARGLEPDRNLADNGIYFVGDQGTMLCGGWSGPPRLVPESKMKDLRAAREDHSPLDRSSRRVDQGLQATGNPKTPRPGFPYSGPFTEAMLCGQPGRPLAETDRVGLGQPAGEKCS